MKQTLQIPPVKKRRVAKKKDECPICSSGETYDATIWYGCNYCPTWFHRDCLPAEDRATADMSVIEDTKYKCYLCVRKELVKSAVCGLCYAGKHAFMSRWLQCSCCQRSYHSNCLSDNGWNGVEEGFSDATWKCKNCLCED